MNINSQTWHLIESDNVCFYCNPKWCYYHAIKQFIYKFDWHTLNSCSRAAQYPKAGRVCATEYMWSRALLFQVPLCCTFQGTLRENLDVIPSWDIYWYFPHLHTPTTNPYTITIVPLVPTIIPISPPLISNTHLCILIWPVSIWTSPWSSLSRSLHCSYTVWVLRSVLYEGRAEPPICCCAQNLRWQVKWLTYPLGLLIQGSRTYRYLRWSCVLRVRVGVRWGKSGGNGERNHMLSPTNYSKDCGVCRECRDCYVISPQDCYYTATVTGWNVIGQPANTKAVTLFTMSLCSLCYTLSTKYHSTW